MLHLQAVFAKCKRLLAILLFFTLQIAFLFAKDTYSQMLIFVLKLVYKNKTRQLKSEGLM